MKFIDKYYLKTILKYLTSTTIAFVIFIIFQTSAYAITFSATTNAPDSDTQVKLQWSIDSRANYYVIFRDNSGAVPDDEVIAVDINSEYVYNTYIHTGLSPSTTYNYYIRAYQDATMANEISLSGNTASVTTANILKPYNITSKYNINSKEVTLTWTSSFAATGSVVDDGNGNSHNASSNTVTFPEASTDSVSYTISSTDAAFHNSGPSAPITVTPISPPEISAFAAYGRTFISWEPYEHINDFYLEHSVWNGVDWSFWNLASNSIYGTETTQYLVTGGTYRYRLTAKNTSYYSGSSDVSDSVVIPKSPISLTGTINNTNSITSITLNWVNDTGNRSDLWVMRQTAEHVYTILTKLPYTATSYTENISVNAGSTYTYQVMAYETEGNTSPGRYCSVTTGVLAAPTGLTIAVTSTSALTLSWSDNNSSEQGYMIERAVNSGSFTQIGTTAANVVSYEDTGLTAGNVYTYRVRAYSILGNSPYSSEASINMADFVAPNKLTPATVSASQIDLIWAYPGTGSYRTAIERKTGASGSWTLIYTTASGVLKYSDTGLMPNTHYFYRVKNYLGSGITTSSYPAGNSGLEAVTKLGGLTLTGYASTGGTIYLTWWGYSSDSDIIIERKMSNGSFAVLTTLNSSTTGWYDNTGLVPGASYTYRVKAKNSTNDSVYSNEATISNVYLNAPSNLTASANSDAGIDLTWNDNSSDETGFEIERRVYGASSYTLYATVDKNITKYADKDAKTGVEYYYRVRAYISGSGLYSGYTNTASRGTGIIGSPTDLKFNYVSESQGNLTWSDNSTNESGFKVEWKIGEDGTWSVYTWVSPNVTSYTINSLNKYNTYYFRVRAYNYSGNFDSLSSELEVSTALPRAPTGISAVPVSSTQVNIKWTDNADNEVGYKISRKSAAQGYYLDVGEVAAGATGYSDRNLYSGVTYTYKVAAFNSGGSAESGEATVTTGIKTTFSDISTYMWAKEGIENLAGRGIIKGKDGNKFKPADTITRAEFVSLMVRAFKLDTTPVGSFADVKVGRWYYREVMIAAYYGIISPDDNNRFYPDRPITREEIALIIYKTLDAAGKPLTGYDNSVLEKFRDRDQISPFALSSMASLVGEGVFTGISGNAIAPMNPSTRAEAAIFIYRVIDR